MGCKSECKYSCIILVLQLLRLNTFHLTILSVTLDCIFVLEMEIMLRDEALDNFVSWLDPDILDY